MTEGTAVHVKPLGIEARLRRRGAWFDGPGLDLPTARRRATATRSIAAEFPAFERVRDSIFQPDRCDFADDAGDRLTALFVEAGLIEADPRGGFSPTDTEASRYLRGGWLEEHAGLAALAAGADEVRIGQCVRWIARGFEGINEIDAIARFGNQLVFLSAKALRSRLEYGDVRHRERLMDALHEADNLIDHFGEPNSAVVLLVTTDLWDERAREPRYEQLHGKAAALGVRLFTLEHVAWDLLVAKLAALGGEVGGGR